ncbi:MAG: FecR domain-containing protein [Bacteroidales bacterium]|nr:FecR domain-containing protein [Bacteroidales bacterium]
MLTKGKISKKQIASYLTGNCSNDEKHRIEQWINASVKNAELYKQYKAVWAYTAPLSDMPDFSVETALAYVHKRIENLETPNKVIFTPKRRNKTLQFAYQYSARVAAVLVIALFAAYFLLPKNTEVITNTITAEAKVLEPLILPDGSKVYLNAGAKFSYPEVFDKDSRTVTLEGEAFFEVTPGLSQPFIVTTGNLGVKVLGTSFNLNASSHLQTVEVAIKTGRVLFYSFDTGTGEVFEQIMLTHGEKGIYYKSNGLIARSLLQNDNCLGWKSGLLEFENTPLPEVLIAIERAYDLHFVCERDFSKLSLTARFDQENPGNILETLRLIFGFQIEESGNQVRIF